MERDGKTTPNPDASSEIRLGDRLICYGNLENVRKICGDVLPEPSPSSQPP